MAGNDGVLMRRLSFVAYLGRGGNEDLNHGQDKEEGEGALCSAVDLGGQDGELKLYHDLGKQKK